MVREDGSKLCRMGDASSCHRAVELHIQYLVATVEIEKAQQPDSTSDDRHHVPSEEYSKSTPTVRRSRFGGE